MKGPPINDVCIGDDPKEDVAPVQSVDKGEGVYDLKYFADVI